MTINRVAGFATIKGQAQPIRILSAFLQRKAIPHALLFTGIEGVGKKTAAAALAMACNCEAPTPIGLPGPTPADPQSAQPLLGGNPCGNCRPCKKIRSGNHPDLHWIAPAGTLIKIAQIRQLCNTLAMRPYEARTRLVIVQDAEAMTPAAGNALLKVLEEPPPDTVLILIARQPADLLPTIVSRCQQIRFHPLSVEIVTELLTEQGLAEGETAALIASMSGGSFTRASAMCSAEWMHMRRWLLEQLAALPELPAATVLAVAERLARHKAWLQDALGVTASWIRDLAVCRHAPGQVLNRDHLEVLRRLAAGRSGETLLAHFDALRSARRNLQGNANTRLTLEWLLFQLKSAT